MSNPTSDPMPPRPRADDPVPASGSGQSRGGGLLGGGVFGPTPPPPPPPPPVAAPPPPPPMAVPPPPPIPTPSTSPPVQPAAPAQIPISVPTPSQLPGPPPAARAREMSEPRAVPLPDPRNIQSPSSVQIGIWGTSGSGKSTFLAALPLAAMADGNWRVTANSVEAAEYLNQVITQLTIERRCPAPTNQTEPIAWTFRGPRRSRLPWGHREVDFALELYDPPGAHFLVNQVEPQIIRSLASSQGLLYLVDPTVRAEEDEMFAGFFEALTLLTTRMQDHGQLRNGRLPHYVAVCVTKLDNERLFRQLARETDFLTQDKHGERLPRIPQRRAKEYFDYVCNRMLGPQAGLVRQALRAHFDPNRIEYFATSAVGFRLNARREFDFADFTNIEMDGPLARIRDMPRPINVLEPLLYLEERIRTGHGR